MTDDLLPIAVVFILWWGLVSIARIISDTRLRGKLLSSNASPEVIAAMVTTPRSESSLVGSLKWGIVLTCVATAIIIVGYYKLEDTPMGFGIALLGAGLGLLIYYMIASQIRGGARTDV